MSAVKPYVLDDGRVVFFDEVQKAWTWEDGEKVYPALVEHLGLNSLEVIEKRDDVGHVYKSLSRRAEMIDIMKSEPEQFEIVDKDKRLFGGWASVEIVDGQGDIVPISELKKAMIDLMDRGGNLNLTHSNKTIGKILQWEIKEHPVSHTQGLHIVGKVFADNDVDNATWEAIKSGKLGGFSIGAAAKSEKRMLKSADGSKKEVGVLHGLSLFEISPVERPANQLSLVDEVNFVAKSMEVEKSGKVRLEEANKSMKEEIERCKGVFEENLKEYANNTENPDVLVLDQLGKKRKVKEQKGRGVANQSFQDDMKRSQSDRINELLERVLVSKGRALELNRSELLTEAKKGIDMGLERVKPVPLDKQEAGVIREILYEKRRRLGGVS